MHDDWQPTSGKRLVALLTLAAGALLAYVAWFYWFAGWALGLLS